jgi:protoporphyrinogen oxidase
LASNLKTYTVILGAGVSGLTTGLALNRLSAEDYGIYEQGSEIGGLCRVQEKEGFRFETVSHVLHFRSEEARQLVHTLLEGNLLRVERSAWIYFRQRCVPYPFQSHPGFLPLAERASCLAGYWRSWISQQLNGRRHPENFGDWIQKHFGPGIARHFMNPYNTKLWGLPPNEMSVDWVRPFVPSGSFGQALLSLLLKRSDNISYNSYFYYPRGGGVQALVDALAAGAPGTLLNKRAVEVDLDRRTVRFQNGQIVRYERLISTIPLRTFMLLARGVPCALRIAAAKLRCTSLLNITCCIRRPLPHSYHWLYFPEPQFPFFRLVFPSNICPSLAPADCSIISAEISNPDLTRQEELEFRVKELLLSLGLIKRLSDISFTVCNFLDHAYPVHDLGRERRVTNLVEFLKSRGVWSIGRFGSWRYSSIDDAITQALQAVRESVESSLKTKVASSG